MEQQVTKQRDSNFELLRIFAMLGIVLAHMNAHGVWFSESEKSGLHFILHETIFSPFGAIGNWLFILISGYFISETSFSWKKLFCLWFQVISISAIVGFITWLSKISVIPHWDTELMELYTQQGFFAVARKMKRYDLITSLLPCYRSNNWFATAYMTFFLFSPLLSIIVARLSQAEHKRLVIILSVFTVIIPMLPGEHFYNPSSVGVFILGFFIAKYINLYNPLFLTHKKRNFFIAIGSYVFMCLWALSCTIIFWHITIPQKYHDIFISAFIQNTSFPVMLCALCIFCAFRSFKIPHNRVINLIASTTFGVYLIHENPLINKWWWHAVCKLDDWISSPYLVGYMLLCTVVTFAICSVLELARKYCLEKPLFALLFRK